MNIVFRLFFKVEGYVFGYNNLNYWKVSFNGFYLLDMMFNKVFIYFK